MILDSNLVILSAKAEYSFLYPMFLAVRPAVSAATRVEVLGYHKLIEDDRKHFEALFAAATVLPISDAVIDRAIALRQARKMSLGDAFIAATALVHDLDLKSHNLKDFVGIPGLRVSDPLADCGPL